MPFNVKSKTGIHTIRDPGDGTYKKVGPVEPVKFVSAPREDPELEIVNTAISEQDSIPVGCVSQGLHRDCPLWIDAHRSMDPKAANQAVQAAERNKAKGKKSKE